MVPDDEGGIVEVVLGSTVEEIETLVVVVNDANIFVVFDAVADALYRAVV